MKAQSEVSIATITMEQQPDLFDCEPQVTMQCSPISLDPHIDQTDLHVQSPLSCAHYSHTAHATMHPDRDVPLMCIYLLRYYGEYQSDKCTSTIKSVFRLV